MLDTHIEVRGKETTWLIQEIMPDGSVYWMVRVSFGPIVEGPSYYGPFASSKDAQDFYLNEIVEGLRDFTVELSNRCGRYESEAIAASKPEG